MFFSRLLTTAALSLVFISSVAAVPSPDAPVVARQLLFNPVGLPLVPLNISAIPAKRATRVTNAARLARGLPLNKPHRRAPGHLKARTSPTPPAGSDAPPPTSSSSSTSSPAAPTCTTYSGSVAATYTSALGDTSGYLSSPNSFGEYQFSQDAFKALQVSYEVCNGADPSVDAFSLLTSNGFLNFPYVAGIIGFASLSPDFSTGSYNYAYIGGSTEVPPNSAAVTQPSSFSAAAGVQEGVETGIWTIDSVGVLTPQWTNSDGSQPATALLYVPSSNAFAVTGDADSFSHNLSDGLPAIFSIDTSV